MKSPNLIVRVVLAGAALAAAGACGHGPGLSSVEPKIGSIQGGEEVRVQGSGFRSDLAYQVYFGAVRANPPVVDGDEALVVITPARPEGAVVDIRVVDAEGRTFVLPHAFTYIDQAAWNPTEALGGGGGGSRARKRRVICP